MPHFHSNLRPYDLCRWRRSIWITTHVPIALGAHKSTGSGTAPRGYLYGLEIRFPRRRQRQRPCASKTQPSSISPPTGHARQDARLVSIASRLVNAMCSPTG
jgi:hypothetical protein